MGPGRRLSTACLAALLAGAPLAAAPLAEASAAPCATAQETEALRVRSLQNKLMVAALSCGQADRYDAFIGRFEHSLVKNGRLMTAYFARRHGGKRVTRVIDDYVTTQANQHSLDSMTNRAGFCQDAQDTFALLLGGDEEALLASAVTIPDNRVESPLACIARAKVVQQPTTVKATVATTGSKVASGG